jgi:hypothetical protein
MSNGSLIRVGAALTATAVVIAGGPALASTLGLADGSIVVMPASWEAQRAVDARNAAASHEAALTAEAERKAAERKARKQAERKAAEKKRRAAEQRAARARAAQGGSPAQNRALGMQMCADKGWSASQCRDLGTLWQKESGWNSRAHNASSGAHGIPQALPGSKMASAGPNWQTSARTQIAWGLGYIQGRYGNPSNALAHSYRTGWY